VVEKYTPEKLVSGVINLVTLPEICRKINLIMADPDHSRHDIESLVSQDPALTMRILRIVNSSYYALPRKIDRVDQAISIIGEDDLSNLILATSATTVLKRLANPLIDFQEFWRHSVE
jgi:HD-like signal output (HDOD) protein